MVAPIDVMGQRLLSAERYRWMVWYAGRLGQTVGGLARVDGSKITLPDPASPLLEGVLRLQHFEGAERYAVAKFLPRREPVIEFGAGLGVVACLTNRLLAGPTRHWVLEANPAVLPVLKLNRDINGASFEIVHGALAYDAKHVSFAVDETVAMSAVTQDTENRRTISVQSWTFADILAHTGLRRCSVVCDIEGAEVELVRREGDALARVVGTLILEVHPHVSGADTVQMMEHSLSDLGFRTVWKHGEVWVLVNSRSSVSTDPTP